MVFSAEVMCLFGEYDMQRLMTITLAIFFVIISNYCNGQEARQLIQPPSKQLIEQFDLDPFYEKALVINGFPILASRKVSDAAIYEAANTVRAMLVNRPDILAMLSRNRIRLAIMAVDERTTDLPEHSDLTPAKHWDRRARGLGATRIRPAVSCAEENLLNLSGDPYATESILVHEFAHAIHLMAVNDIDKSFDQRLESAYRDAIKEGLWKGLYAADNSREYFAEAVQSWFDTNRENDSIHNHVNTREELLEYDPAVAKLCLEVFGENDWRYVRSDAPSRQHEPHLKLLDRAKLPRFRWDKPQRVIQ